MASHGLSDEQLAACMAASAAWPHAAADDGWVRAHDALREDMEDLRAALEALAAHAAAGKALTGWQVATLQADWARFQHMVHFHHEHEETLVFPFITKRVAIPAKLSADHKELVDLLGKCSRGVAAVRAGPAQEAALRDLMAHMATFQEAMCAHLLEEEQVGLPILRHHFTLKEYKPVEQQIVAHATPADLAWITRPMAGDVARREWMTQVAAIPKPVQALVMMPAIRRYHRNVVVPMAALKAGETQAPPSDGGCACSVM